VTAVQPLGRFGAMAVTEEGDVSAFQEKPVGDGSWVNGGFFVLEPAVLEHLDADETVWEREPLEKIAANGELVAYRHEGFWQPMDTLRDKQYLEGLWESGQAPWKVWE
jgi:glucose-1-phosphate cytidylyltransferase